MRRFYTPLRAVLPSVRHEQLGSFGILLCIDVEAVEPLPDGDVVVMHKLMIEGNEDDYLRTANRFEPTLYGFIALRPRARNQQ